MGMGNATYITPKKLHHPWSWYQLHNTRWKLSHDWKNRTRLQDQGANVQF